MPRQLQLKHETIKSKDGFIFAWKQIDYTITSSPFFPESVSSQVRKMSPGTWAKGTNIRYPVIGLYVAFKDETDMVMFLLKCPEFTRTKVWPSIMKFHIYEYTDY